MFSYDQGWLPNTDNRIHNMHKAALRPLMFVDIFQSQSHRLTPSSADTGTFQVNIIAAEWCLCSLCHTSYYEMWEFVSSFGIISMACEISATTSDVKYKHMLLFLQNISVQKWLKQHCQNMFAMFQSAHRAVSFKTYRPLVPHICVSWWGQHWFR